MADDIQGLTVKVGITDEAFTGGISKINKAMSLLQSEFKASSEGLKGFGNSSEQLNNKSEYLNKALDLQKQKVKSLQEAYEKSKAETGEFSNSTMNAGTKVNNAVAQFAKMQNELKQVDEELSKTGKEAEEQGNTFTSLGDKVKNAFSGMGEYVKRGIGLAIGGDIWDKAKESFTEMITFGSDLQVSLNGIESATGYNENAMSGMKQVMTDIYNDNFGENFEDIGEAIKRIAQQTSTSGNELKGLAENALLVRDTFDMDVNESIRSANMMINQFGLSGDEAYNLIAQGAQRGLDKNGDLLDSVNEYSVHFKQLGLSAEDMFNMLENGTASGTFSVDKLGDAVKEFGIRVKDGTDDEAFQKLGLSADELKLKFAQGGDSAKESFEKTISALLNMQDPIEQNTLGVTMFGTMWEDLGVKGITALTDTTGEISNTTDALKDINNVKYNDIGSAFEGIKRNIQTGILLPISDKLLPKLNEFGQWFKSNMPSIKEQFSNAFDKISPMIDTLGTVFTFLISNINTIIPLVITFGATFTALKVVGIIQAAITAFTTFKTAIIAGKGVMTAFNLVCDANPISLIVIGIGALVAGLVLLYNKCEPFRNFVNWVASEVVNLFTTTIPEAFNSMIQWFSGLPEKASALWTSITTAFTNGWNGIVNFFTTTIPTWIESIATWFGELPNKIAEKLGNLIGLLATWGINVWSYFSTNVPIWINGIVTFFSELPNKIWTWLVSVVTKLGEWGSNIITWISTNVPIWISNIVTFFSELPNKIWTWLVSCVTNVTTWGTNMLNEAKTGMDKVVTGITDAFKNLPSKMMDIGKNIVNGIKEGFSSAWDSMIGWVGGLCDSFTKGVKDKFEIHSPSHIFRDEIGKMLAMGIGVGFEQEMPQINTNMSKTIDGTVKIANLDNLKSVNSAYSNNSKSSSNVTLISRILDKMDSLEKAFDVSINLNGEKVGRIITPNVSNNLAFNNNKRGW